MGRRLARIAERQFPRGARDHLDDRIGDILLHAEQPQRRAALAGGAERRRHHVVGHLLGQRGGVDDHRVDAAGLGDQRHDRRVLAGKRAVDRARHLGRAGEGDAGDARIGRPARAPILPSPGTRCSALAGMPAWCRRRTASEAIERGLLGRLRHHRVAGGKRRRDLAEEDRQREIPRADADEHAAPAIAQLVRFAGRPRQHLRRERACAPRPRSSGRNRSASRTSASASSSVLPPSTLQQRDQAAAVCLDQIAGAVERRGTVARPAWRSSPQSRRSPPSSRPPRSPRRPRAPGRSPRRRSASGPRARCPEARCRRPAGRRAAAARRRARSPAAPRGSRGRRTRRPANCGATARRDRAAAGSSDGGRAAHRPIQLCGRLSRVATGTAGSAATDTNEELAPFSSRRRTR